VTAPMDADRVLADLHELARLTGGPDGARRVCWTEEWTRAREFLRSRLDELPVEVSIDAAGNLWADLPGEQEGFVIVGSHVDSVPAGGWLDGALGVFVAVEALRAHAGDGKRPAVGLRLVDWADEEGARFGRSLFGSSACAGTLEVDEVRDLRDRDGERLEEVVARYDVALDRVHESGARLRGARAYLEMHIEQGPVLESRGEPAATVLGTCGVERHVAVFTGQAAHAGATPMGLRRDSFAATAQAALAIREVGFRHDGVCTVGGATSEPGVVTAVAGRTEMLLDQRHLDPDELAAMLAEARDACERAAADQGCEVELQHLWSIPPIPFDDRLIALARQAVVEAGGKDTALPSGPLHDAAEMARLIPTVMLFSSSSPPVSHTKEEDTPEGDLRVAIEAYGRTVAATLASAAAGELPPRA
jgi:hydantoinase/carbamoylase family amidase